VTYRNLDGGVATPLMKEKKGRGNDRKRVEKSLILSVGGAVGGGGGSWCGGGGGGEGGGVGAEEVGGGVSLLCGCAL